MASWISYVSQSMFSLEFLWLLPSGSIWCWYFNYLIKILQKSRNLCPFDVFIWNMLHQNQHDVIFSNCFLHNKSLWSSQLYSPSHNFPVLKFPPRSRITVFFLKWLRVLQFFPCVSSFTEYRCVVWGLERAEDLKWVRLIRDTEHKQSNKYPEENIWIL